MLKGISRLALAAALATGTLLPTTAFADGGTAIFLVIENGGVVTDRQAAMETVSATLGELVELRRRRELRDAQISIVLTASPTEIAWTGTPDQLREQGLSVLNLIGFFDTCSDLVRAWEQVDLSARISRPDDTMLIGIGPFIHAGYPCGQDGGLITLPQAVPAEVKLGELGTSASLIRLLNVHPDQDEMIVNDFEASGVMERASGGFTDFDLLDPAQTRARLGSVLKDR
jgi:hypothetical protein